MSATAVEAPPLLLQVRGLAKQFPGVQALQNIDFDVRRGEVHVLLGENGAGKSTLVKILTGAQRADAGEIIWHGQPVDIASPHQAQTLGISAIYQEFNLVPHMTVAENVFLGREPVRGGVLDRKTMHDEARTILDSLDVHIPTTFRVSRLGVAEQQM